MAKALPDTPVVFRGYEDIDACLLKWPMSVIRLRSSDKEQLSAASAMILQAWRAYTDETVNIHAFTDGVMHNTITPIARMKDGMYECDLVLRNNITSDDRPLGVYHPNPTLHHIKKENIGLIEVMGLAVLPARLSVELEAVRTALLNGDDLTADPQTASHAAWVEEFLPRHPEFNADNAMDIIKAEVGAVFEQVLFDAGVFKRDDEGRTAFRRFIETL